MGTIYQYAYAVVIVSTLAFSRCNCFSPIDAYFQRSKLPMRYGRSFASSSSSSVNGISKDEKIEQHYSIHDSFNLIVLGDLHIEDDMDKHYEARDDCLDALRRLSIIPSPSKPFSDDNLTIHQLIDEMKDIPASQLSVHQLSLLLEHKRQGDFLNCHLVSLGDLGRKDIRHEPGDAGTTKSFVDAKNFLDSFGLSYDLVTGNHDLEGLDEFKTDEDNLQAWMDVFHKDTPYFRKYIGERTLLIGISTVRFRDAPHSSHECHADSEQLEWFERVVAEHPAEEGWRICVFSHAPIMGSNLRVLQNVHVINGCAWMNHCSPSRSLFIDVVKKSPQIKAWFSGHFHLSHEFEDSISRVNQCTFCQVGVVGLKSTRDHTRQTRIVQGSQEFIKIYSVSHHKRNAENQADLRLDVTVDLETGETVYAHGNEDYNSEDWFSAYIPQEEDGCYLESPSGRVAGGDNHDETLRKVCWWHMSDGKVLGVHEGQIVEYDASTLSPLGIVVNSKELGNREVLVVDDSRALVLVNPDNDEMEVIHPNDDGSYWRKYQRNKRVRQEEKAREAAAKLWLERKHEQMVSKP